MASLTRRGTKANPLFYANYRDANGIKRMKRLKGAANLEQARALMLAIERNIMQGKVGIEVLTDEQKAARALTVRQLGEKFLAEYSNPKVKSMKLYRREAKWKLASRINPRLGDRACAELTVADIERFRDVLLEKPASLTPSSVRLTLALLSKMFAWGRKQGLIAVESPTRGCVRPSAASSLDYLAREEVQSLIETTEQLERALVVPGAAVLRAMVTTAIYTGMRKGELFGLRWPDVHLDGARIDVARSYDRAPKSGKPRHIPAHPELVRVLRAWKERCPATDAGLLFPVEENGTAPKMGRERHTLGLANVLRLAGSHVPDHPWHALRHSFASHFMMAGGNILTLQKLLGHSTLAMTMVYAHLSPDHLAGEIARMSFAPRAPAGTADFAEEQRKRALEQR